MRWLGGIALSILVVVGLLTLLGQGPAMPVLGGAIAPAAEEPASGYAAKHARLVQTDAMGAPQYVLEAEQMSQNPGSEDIAARDLRLDYVAADATGMARPWRLTAREGALPGGGSQITVSGRVRLSGTPRGTSVPVRIETSVLNFDIDQQLATTSVPVNFYWGTRRVSARGLHADLKRDTLRLESSVHGRFPP